MGKNVVTRKHISLVLWVVCSIVCVRARPLHATGTLLFSYEVKMKHRDLLACFAIYEFPHQIGYRQIKYLKTHVAFALVY
jgi:hypothetical protein